MSHHYSGPNFGFPRGDARLDFTDLYAFPKPGDWRAVRELCDRKSEAPPAILQDSLGNRRVHCCSNSPDNGLELGRSNLR